MTGPADGSSASAAFDRHRRLLFTVAYQLLGSVSDAEDAVQDAWLRWSAADRSTVVDERAYLVQIVSRVALNQLRAARTRRESYVGPWLPEPLLTDRAGNESDPARTAELTDQVSLALLVVLETLSPVERAVFVLREVFGMPYAEVATALGRSEAAVRQLAHRARSHVEARRPRFGTDRRAQREVTERFLAACAGGDVDALLAVLSPGAVLVSDGGGRAKAALRPIVGAAKVARFLLGIAGSATAGPPVSARIADVNGLPGIVAWRGGEPLLAASLVLVDGRVEQVLIVRNPDKLTALGPPPPSRMPTRPDEPGRRRRPRATRTDIGCAG